MRSGRPRGTPRRPSPAFRPPTRCRRRPRSSGPRAGARAASRGIHEGAPAIGRRRSPRRGRRRRSSLTSRVRRDADVARQEAARTSPARGVGGDRPPPDQRVRIEELPVQRLVVAPETPRTTAQEPGRAPPRRRRPRAGDEGRGAWRAPSGPSSGASPPRRRAAAGASRRSRRCASRRWGCGGARRDAPDGARLLVRHRVPDHRVVVLDVVVERARPRRRGRRAPSRPRATQWSWKARARRGGNGSASSSTSRRNSEAAPVTELAIRSEAKFV